MKRPAPPEPPPRRKRGLSEEERALWEQVARQIKPLRKKQRVVRPASAAPAEPIEVAAKPAATAKPHPVKRIVKPLKAPTPTPPPALAPLGRRERSHLSRGRKDIEARIDLHGMTQSRAHHALFAFLQRASGDGLTFVLVITGKGRSVGPDSERGVLRRQVPHWLGLPEFRALVVGFEEAHIGHGGEGALYVRVRRAR
ncbi:MAG: Smr/MutS family protein [Rhodopseudomonas sp.]|uniref:Smr/MutS family protein n=1 Tax=Rhodopseudomonas sp. TaxID=1078 RepID=UPI00180D1BFE|nr:Smr/MutS family protein [Rhodopseudomonas sp.]NVN85909.1 Smr/MutS family protein [Rhodopseudomonas sp.]